MAAKIKKGDKVIVITGADKGAVGMVEQVLPKENRVIVEGVAQGVRHVKPSQADPDGGKRPFSRPIHISNVALVDPKEDKATPVGFRFDDNGSKIRFAKRSGEAIDG